MVIAAKEIARLLVTDIELECRTVFQNPKQVRTAQNLQIDCAPSRNIKHWFFPTNFGMSSQPSGLSVPSDEASSHGARLVTGTPSRSSNLIAMFCLSALLSTPACTPVLTIAEETWSKFIASLN
ncbi:hypothetical protein [Bradyrhizobium sp. 191]|uniref:hypothetical protein n=1 Tax=Bradyrhizobium sp. 191 TaxID=2782659 RepID=UPI001FFECF21|nr:hypothetical protein [Bradyrhizobium sp. 191]UPJ64247.1 hypothetical protein IVB23_30395 [Bradyrhizobium sp. 191]